MDAVADLRKLLQLNNQTAEPSEERQNRFHRPQLDRRRDSSSRS